MPWPSRGLKRRLEALRSAAATRPVAIGARARDIHRLVLREGLLLVIAGIAVGTVGAFASTRLLIGYLYGVSQTDSLAFVAGPAVLIAIAIVAAYLPARKAASTNPLEAIRSE
jgi:putative ABC transport system permease protein